MEMQNLRLVEQHDALVGELRMSLVMQRAMYVAMILVGLYGLFR